MAKLNIGKTAFSGFGVIGRHPIAPIIWGVVALVLALGPMLLVLPTMLEFFAMGFRGATTGAQPDTAEMMRLQNQMNIVSPLSWIAGLLSYAVTTGAVFRAMLKPAEKSWFFMRVGMGELMLVAVSIVYFILLVVAFLVAALVVGIIGFAVAQASQNAGIIAAVVSGLAALGVLIWVGLRFSLAFAMSWDRKSFLLFESWKLTAGNGLALVLMALVNFIVCFVISGFIFGILIGFGAFAALGNGGFEALSGSNPEAFFTPERLMALLPWGIALVVLSTIVQAYLNVVMTAPYAEAYRELVPPVEEVA